MRYRSKRLRIATASLLTAFLAILSASSKPEPKSDFVPRPQEYIFYNQSASNIPKYEYRKSNRIVDYFVNWYKPTHFVKETITEVSIEYTYLGYYYITAYAPEECGYNGYNYPTGWTTASGAICHRADYENRLTEPTTCAIDRSLHRFGDLFYIPDFDRIFVAEDTGGAVRGKHIDLFYDYYGMLSFPTGSYEVYAVEYIYTDAEVEYYDFEKKEGIMRIVYLQNKKH